MAKTARLVLLAVLATLPIDDAAADAAVKKYRIAYVARAQGDSFAAWLANSMVAEAKKYPDLSVTVFDGQSRNELIASHIENAVTGRYDLVLIQPLDSEAQVAPARAALAAGVKVMTCNNRINDPSIPGIDADPIQQAAENAKLAVKQVPEERARGRAPGPGRQHALSQAPRGLADVLLQRPPGREDRRGADRQLEQGRGDAVHGGLDPVAVPDRRHHLHERQHGGGGHRGGEGFGRQDLSAGLRRRWNARGLPLHQEAAS